MLLTLTWVHDARGRKARVHVALAQKVQAGQLVEVRLPFRTGL